LSLLLTQLLAVPLELVDMPCKSLHIKGTPFPMLPNPTSYPWDKSFFNLRRPNNEYHKPIKPISDSIPGLRKFERLARRVVEAIAKNREEEKGRRRKESSSFKPRR